MPSSYEVVDLRGNGDLRRGRRPRPPCPGRRRYVSSPTTAPSAGPSRRSTATVTPRRRYRRPDLHAVGDAGADRHPLAPLPRRHRAGHLPVPAAALAADDRRARTTSSGSSETPGFLLPENATAAAAARELDYPTRHRRRHLLPAPGHLHLADRRLRRRPTPTSAPGPSSTFTIAEPDVVSGQAVALDGRALDAATRAPTLSPTADPSVRQRAVHAGPRLGSGDGRGRLPRLPGRGPRLHQPASLDPYAVTINSRWTPTSTSCRAGRQPVRPGLLLVHPALRRSADPSTADRTRSRRPTPRPTRSARSRRRSCRPSRSTSHADRHRGHLRVAGLRRPTRASATSSRVYFAGGAAPSHQTGSQLPAPGGPVRDDQRQQRHRRRDRRPDDLHRACPHLPRGRPVVAGAGHRRRTATGSPGRTPASSTKATPGRQPLPRRASRPDRRPDSVPDLGARQPTARRPASSRSAGRRRTSTSTWKIEVYKNDDTTLSNGNLVLDAYVEAGRLRPARGAAAVDAALPLAGAPLRRDAAPRPSGRWSDLGRFCVDTRPCRLAGPDNGAPQPPNGRVLTW